MARLQLCGELVEDRIDQRGLALERALQRIERGRAGREPLAVARQLEVRRDAVADHVGDVIDIQAREVLRAIGHAEATERPRERIVVPLARDRVEPRAFGQQLSTDDAQCQPGISALEEPHDCIHRALVGLRVREEVRDRGRQFLVGLAGALRELVMHALEAGAAEHAQEQLDRRIRLYHLEIQPFGVELEKARQVRRRGVRRVELRHRGRDQEQAQASPR